MSLINVTECCKMPGLQLLPFLSEGRGGGGVNLSPDLPTQFRFNNTTLPFW